MTPVGVLTHLPQYDVFKLVEKGMNFRSNILSLAVLLDVSQHLICKLYFQKRLVRKERHIFYIWLNSGWHLMI